MRTYCYCCIDSDVVEMPAYTNVVSYLVAVRECGPQNQGDVHLAVVHWRLGYGLAATTTKKFSAALVAAFVWFEETRIPHYGDLISVYFVPLTLLYYFY